MKIRTIHCKKSAQTFVFLVISLTAIFLLCGLGIDTGLLFLSKARLARACDAATLEAVGNFQITTSSPENNRQAVAELMRNVAVANYSDLSVIATTPYLPGVSPNFNTSPVMLPGNIPGTQFEYDFFPTAITTASPSTPSFIVYLQCGQAGSIVQATCVANYPTKTYFMGFAGPQFEHIGVASSALAKRNPRLVVVVVDRSSSMLGNYGCSTLPQAVANFMSYFDPNNDSIGLVSFGSGARIEFPLTTNFIYAATNDLSDTVDPDSLGYYQSLPDPEEDPVANPGYWTNGPRRLKFGGFTCADEGIRLGLEMLMSNAGFNNPNIQKIMVIFTDGAWNTARTLVAAPGYTNTVQIAPSAVAWTTAPFYMPTLTPYASYTNSLGAAGANQPNGFTVGGAYGQAAQHTNDVMQSVDSQNENESALGGNFSQAMREGGPTNVVVTAVVGTNALSQPMYTSNLNVWVPVGAVDYTYHADGTLDTNKTVVSRLSQAFCETNTAALFTNIIVEAGGSNVLVVPGYVADGTVWNDFETACTQNTYNGYNADNYCDQAPGSSTACGYMPDVTTNLQPNSPTPAYNINSGIRQALFRNFMNLLTGASVMDPYDPPQTGPGAYDNLIPIAGSTNYFARPLHPLGEYYPSAPNFFSFNDVGLCFDYDFGGPNTPGANFTTEVPAEKLLPGEGYFDSPETYVNFRYDTYGAAPQLYTNQPYYGCLYYAGTNRTVISRSTGSVSSNMTTANWTSLSTNSTESWITAATGLGSAMTTATMAYDNFDTNGAPTTNSDYSAIYVPASYRGFAYPGVTTDSAVTNTWSKTGGMVFDDTVTGSPVLYTNSMAYSGRPTHYYDFSISAWVPMVYNHTYNDGCSDSTGGVWGNPGNAEVEIQSPTQFGHLCFWKAMEYAYHARQLGVTIFTVGYSDAVQTGQCDVLAEMANAPSYTRVDNSSPPVPYTVPSNPYFDRTQPSGLMFYATDANSIATDFQQIAASVTGYLAN